MRPVLTIFGINVPAYGFMAVCGFVAAILCLLPLSKKLRLAYDDTIYVFVFACVGAVIGAKLLYLLTAIPQIAADLPLLKSAPGAFFAKYLSGGMVFFGGLLGGIAAAALAARYFRLRLMKLAPALLPAAVLLAGCGRIGCFLAGCCYGKETALPIGVVFPHGSLAPAGVPLFPTQLTEAAFDFILCGLLIFLACRRMSGKRMLALYLLAYCVFRFLLEFARGDAIRGAIGIFSTSQIICLAVIAAVLLWIAVGKRRAR